MTYRVSTASLARHTLSDLGRTQERIAGAREEIATGKRINRPSDDPGQAARLRELDTARARHVQYERNASLAESRLALEESTLGSFGDSLGRIRDLTVQGRNGTNGPVEREAIAVEIAQNLSGLYELANVRDTTGDALFGGSRTAGAPFAAPPVGSVAPPAYAGDGIERRVSLGGERSVSTAHAGDRAFMAIPDGSGGTRDAFGRVASLVEALRAPAGDAAAEAARGAALDASLAALDGALEHVSLLRADAGARLRTVDTAREESAAIALQLDATVASVRDADITDAVVRLESESRSLELLQKSHARLAGLSILDYLR